MKNYLLKVTIILFLFIFPINLRAAEAVYLPFSISSGSDQSEKFTNSVVASNDAHWGWIEEYWSKGNGIGSKHGGTKKNKTHHDGIILGKKKTTAESSGLIIKTYFQTKTNGEQGSLTNQAPWNDKYIIIESKEVVKTIQLTTSVFESDDDASFSIFKRPYYWSIFLTNNKDDWGFPAWISFDKSNNTTVDLTESPVLKYDSIRGNKYVVICYSGDFTGCISNLVINENTYLNVVEEPQTYVVNLGEYQTQDILVDFCNLDGKNNTNISDFTVTSSDTKNFVYTGQDGNDLGLFKFGQRSITIRFQPSDPTPKKYTATITIQAGSLKKTVTVVGYSYKPQDIIWNQNFSRLSISDADITLNAYSSVGLTPITYTSNNTDVVTIVDGKLHIVGKGRTSIKASQAGDGTYAPVTKIKYVYVGDPEDPCEPYDLYEPGQVTLHTIDDVVYELYNMPADKLTFDACRTLTAITSSLVTGKKYFKVAESTNGGKTFNEIASFDDMPRSEILYYIPEDGWKNYTVQLSENATHVKIYTSIGATMRHHIKNVIVTPKSYIRPTVNEVKISPEIGSINYSTTLRIAYSALFGNMNLEMKTSTSQFTLDQTEIPMPCGDVDTVNVTITMPNVPCTNEIQNIIKITNGSHLVEVPIIVTPTKGFQLINWTTVPTGVNTSSELTTADMGATVAPRYIAADYSSDNPEIADFDGAGNFVIKQPGTVTIRASKAEDNCYASAEDVTKTITITQDYLTFDDKDKDKDWFNKNNWKPNRTHIPNHLAFATLEADVEIDDNAKAKKLTLDNHNVYIKSNGYLHAETTIGGNTEEPLIVLAAGDDDHAAGAIATTSTDVKANVGIYVKATTQAENTTWQYFGVPFSQPSVPAFYEAWVCQWSEASGSWSYKNTSDVLQPWIGYCITQPKITETYGYEINGTIQTGNHTYQLTKTKNSPYEGNNIITNSYTAPIDITKLESSDFINTEQTIYIYNTGSYSQWDSHKDVLATKDAMAGQYLAIPIKVASYTPYDLTIIPPMQAFCLKATGDDASFTVDYNRAVWSSTSSSKPKRVLRRNRTNFDADEENLIIHINGKRFGDAISILKRAECSSDYDDGYDAYKWTGNSLAPQLYSIEDNDDIYSIDSRETLEGHYIGIDKGEDDTYTLTFSLVETEDFYYLKDLSNNQYYPIIEDMSIDVEVLNSMSRRFKIVSEMEMEEDEQEKPSGVTTDIRMSDGETFLTNATDQPIDVNVYDMTGRLIRHRQVEPRATLDYKFDQLPHGTYIINFGDKNIKIVL